MRNWDSKTVLAGLFIGLYFALAWFLPGRLATMSPASQEIVNKLLDPLGPVIGIIAFALWRTSTADDVRSVAAADVGVTNAKTAQLAAHKAPPATGPAYDPPVPDATLNGGTVPADKREPWNTKA